ncbi:hypothetical protein Tco_0841199 [Tanacetum coccineum]|uniref:Reverse transcriptase domain-containing protein n=1 Tax=Tanacetum coccineum TaxID=301880 RepID=A0ABQ5AXZ4_9ASTR
MDSNVNKRKGTTKADELRAQMQKSQAETVKATGSLIKNSIRVSQNPNEDYDVHRVYETVTTTIKDPMQSEGGPIRVSHYAGLFTSNSNTNATSFEESLTVNPSNVVESGVKEDVISSNLSGGETRLFGSNYPDPFSISSTSMDSSHFPKGDGVKIATQAGRFVHVSSSMDGGSSLVHKEANTINIEDSIVHSVDINTKPTSYAGATSGNTNPSSTTSSFCHLVADPVFDGVNISIPCKVVENVSLRFEHTLYGYFIGKRMAFPVVEYYARSNWAKHGLKRIMMNTNGFFFFKFDSRAGLEAVLEGGPWVIRNSLIILKKWSMKTSLQKEELTRILIWVKLHDVPIQVFEEDGISLIATYLGKPIMLDSYTSSMCKDSWGRNSFSRCLIEINLEADFKESITIGIPDLDGPGYTKETIRVEYECKPPRCPTCNIFGHTGEACPKKVVTNLVVNDTNAYNDGFQKVVNRKHNNKGSSTGNKLPKGVPVSKGFQVGKDFAFKPKAPNVGSNGDNGTRDEPISKAGPSKTNNGSLNTKDTNARQQDTGKKKISNIASPNPFAALGVDDDEEEEVENVWDESENLNFQHIGASTPAQTVVNENNLSVCAILESHVDVAIVYDTCKKVCKWTSNGSLCPKGTQIIIGWNDDLVDVMIMAQTNQVMHVQNNLVGHASLMHDKSQKYNNLVLLGDFNVTLNLEDHSCVLSLFSISDHSPCVLRIPKVIRPKPKPFKFSNFLIYKEGFRDVVSTGWNLNVHGCAMYRVVKRLKGLKTPLPINRNPSCSLLRDEHAYYLLAFKEASLDEEIFLRQKSKIEWLNARDANTTYFHRIVKCKCARNRIEMVRDSSNVLHERNAVHGAFVSHYEQFLGLEGASTPLDDQGLFTRVLANHKAEFMVREVSDNEIKDALFSMGDDKAPGPDGFTAAFFKKSWDIMGGEITNAVRDFFSNGKLLKELNHTIIFLIPKVSTPAKITDYHLISCYNVLFKCIIKIIANRIKEDLRDLVSINQSAFVSGRRISDNILLTPEFMRTYHCKRGPPRCAFKVDIQKAYDMVNWGFLRSILAGFGFHPTMVECIMVCVSTTSYSVCINGDMYGWFNECKSQRNFSTIIFVSSNEFKNVSGLVPSIPKSTAFFCNVSNALKASILSSMPFAEGTLRVKYLGVPLISSRLLYHDCKVLIDKLESRVNDWRNKFLSLAGHLQLKGKAKVAWEAVCLLHREGGLEIRRLDDFNVALMTTHVWCILINKESLWVQWIHSYKLKGRSLWDVPCLGDVSWGWRKLLQIWTRIRPFIWHKINNGRSTSMWFDRWADSCPLRDMLTVRNIVRFGFSLSNTVSDLISNGTWRWPHDWSSRFPNVVNIPVPDINNELDDVIVWRNVQGVFHRFSVAGAWDSLWLRADVVWIQVCAFTGMSFVPPRLVDVLEFLIPSKGSLVSNKSTRDHIVQLITSLARMKLVTFKFKKMTNGSRLLLDQWKISSSCFDHDRSKLKPMNEIMPNLTPGTPMVSWMVMMAWRRWWRLLWLASAGGGEMVVEVVVVGLMAAKKEIGGEEMTVVLR